MISYNWSEALNVAEQASFAGADDWRLPNHNELQSIVEQRCYGPSINLTIFPNCPGVRFWSASPYAGNSDLAWNVYFTYGYVNYYYKNYDGAVRLVRGGQ